MASGPRPNPLSAARAAVGLGFCAALAGAALALDHPVAILGVIVAIVAVGSLAGRARLLARTALFSLPLAITVGLVNALTSRQGDTVVARLGSLPVIGRLDITAESLSYSGVLILRVEAIVLAAALFSACVDADALLRLLRRRSSRFGLSVGLAARLAPLLARDGKRMAAARRTLAPSVAAPRSAIVEALATGALDRAVDTAAALELRGLGDGPCLAPAEKRRWSRHDRAMALSASVIAILSAVSLAAGWSLFSVGPTIRAADGLAPWVVAALIPLIAVSPMLDRRGVAR